VHKRILVQLRQRIRTRAYLLTVHADEEMDADELSIYDIEQCILTGQIVERQKDSKTGEWKCLVKGATLQRDQLFLVAKLSPTRKLVSITVYVE